GLLPRHRRNVCAAEQDGAPSNLQRHRDPPLFWTERRRTARLLARTRRLVAMPLRRDVRARTHHRSPCPGVLLHLEVRVAHTARAVACWCAEDVVMLKAAA